MIQFKGTAACNCGHEFEWVATKPERGEFIFGEIDKQNKKHLIYRKNIGLLSYNFEMSTLQ